MHPHHHIVRVTYFDADKSHLLLGAVEPLLAELAQLAEPAPAGAAWVRPHWKFGPHIDLHLPGDAAHFADTVFPLAKRRLRAWLRDHPSMTELDAERYQRHSVMLGKTENDAGPYLPLYDNNTVSAAAGAPLPMMGLASIGALRDEFLARSMPLVFDLLRLRREDQGRFHLMLAQMMVCVTQIAAPGGARVGHLSFRAHAEAFIASFPAGRAEFDRFSHSLGPRLREQLVPLLDGFAAGARAPGRAPLLAAFCALVADLLPRLAAIVASDYAGIDLQVGRDRAGGANPIFDMMRGEQVQNFIQDPGYVPYRVLINFFYLLMPVLSVTPAQRFCLCHITADACQEIFDIDWKQIFFPNKVEH